MLMVFTFAFYSIYAFVREISCIVICPYGRLQGVLLDRNSIVVIYDYLRGEPRSKKRKTEEKKGDCIDCGMCVNVCPTGIDIRNGTQLECVNCTACIDACNVMMKNVGLEPDLIKFGSENDIEKGEKTKITYRVKAYSGVLILLIGILVSLLITRTKFDATVLRVPGQILQENADGTISNLYKIRVVSKSAKTEPFDLSIDMPNAKIEYVGTRIDSLKPSLETEQTFFIKIPKDKITKRRNQLKVFLKANNEIIQTKKISFIGKY
jgi:cytochrome c oxidase accessory protein FixG